MFNNKLLIVTCTYYTIFKLYDDSKQCIENEYGLVILYLPLA